MNLPDFFDTLQEIADLQEKRRANWNDNAPINEDLEAKHQEQLEELRKKLP